MRHLHSFILFCGITILAGCNGSDGTSPEGNGNDDGFQVQDSATIGAAGGRLVGEHFTVIIPEGAFDGDFELELSASNSEQPWGAAMASALYQLGGVPEDHAEPLQILIPGESSESDTVFVAIGRETFVTSLAAEEVTYGLFQTAPSDSGYSVELPSSPPGNVSISTEKNWARAIYIFRTRSIGMHPSDGGHFHIFYPRDLVALPLIQGGLTTWLDEAFTKFESELGYSYAGRQWPMDVYTFPFPLRPDGLLIGGSWVTNPLGINYGHIRVNSDILANAVLGKALVGHEFFHFIQTLYDPRGAYAIAYETARHLWLMEACSVWSEELFSDNPLEYIPPALAYYPATCLDNHGLQPATSVTPGPHAAHGYGMGGLIKHLAETYEVNKIRLIWQNIRTGHHPVAAIIRAVGQEPSQWWPQYLNLYLAGDIYQQGARSFMPALQDSFVITAAADTVKHFPATYQDISAKLYKVNLEYPGMHDQTVLTFSTDPPEASISIFRRLNAEIDLVAHDVGNVSLPDLKSLMDQSYQVLVAVQNCAYSAPDFNGSRNLELTMKLTSPDVFQMQTGSIYFGSAEVSMAYEGEDCTTPTTTGTLFLRWQNLEGQWTGSVFNGSFDDTYACGDASCHEYGSICITMDELGRNVIGWTADKTLVTTTASSGSILTTEAEWTGDSIAWDPNPGIWDIRFTQSGAGIGDGISLTKVHTYQGLDCTGTMTILQWLDFSQLYVGFTQ